MKPPYPEWICLPCGQKFGRRPQGGISAWHMDNCWVCGKITEVTQPRDFGHLKEWPIKKEGET